MKDIRITIVILILTYKITESMINTFVTINAKEGLPWQDKVSLVVVAIKK